MPSVAYIMLIVAMLSVVMLSVVMLSVVMLSVVMLSVVILNATAPVFQSVTKKRKMFLALTPG